MKLHQINLVQTTFTAVEAQAAQFVDGLYEHLFRLDPCLCYLFPKEMAAHKEKFMVGLAEIVAGLDRPFVLIQTVLKPLGLKHAKAGIHLAHYHTFAAALQYAMADTLGDAFTAEVEAAWTEAYYLAIGVMRETISKNGE
jgi:hemoglobin-like flavoprotein